MSKYFFFMIFSYKPTRLWGFSGHVQTIVHSIIGRVRCPWPIGERVYISLPDETTLTYDLYQPLTQAFEGELTIYQFNLENWNELKTCLNHCCKSVSDKKNLRSFEDTKPTFEL